MLSVCTVFVLSSGLMQMYNRSGHIFGTLPLLTGVLLWLAWPPLPTTWLIFIAFLPLLAALEMFDNRVSKGQGFRYWLIIFSAFLVWNVATTWWVGKASVGGGLFANFANPALQSLAFMLFRSTRRRLGRKSGYVALVAYWMAFEYLHLRWEFTWPWLTLGNVFARQHTWVQWYSVTGVFGGTLWIWIVNILFYEWLRPFFFPGTQPKPVRITFLSNRIFQLICILVVIAFPVILSYNIYKKYVDIGEPVNVTVMQPNFNPYTEKFSMPYDQMVSKMLQLSVSGLSDSTDYLVWPETSVPQPIWLNDGLRSRPIRMIKEETDSFPNLTTIFGANAFERYDSPEQYSPTVRQLINPRFNDTIWFDAFNTAIQIDTSDNMEWYHKSKLVPGAERMPYPQALKFMEYFTLDLGGISGSLGIQNEREVLFNSDSLGVATAICYESVFGEFMSRYIRNGAGLIFIITNDGWWGDTDGYKQHCMYGRLRAIENRKSIARSANTGISCFINQRGDILQPTEWETEAVISETLYYNDTQTFYTRNGDFLARTAIWVGALLWMISFVRNRIAKTQISRRVK